MKLTIRQIARFGMLGALTYGAKVAMAALPNIEPVSLMIMLFAVVFGIKGLYPMYLYVALEILLGGINLWNINYLYVWLVLFLGAYAVRKLNAPFWFTLLSSVFGMAFGFLCTPVYMCIGGFSYGIRWWMTGIYFDVTHAVGNFVIAWFLFDPMRKLLTKLYRKIEH